MDGHGRRRPTGQSAGWPLHEDLAPRSAALRAPELLGMWHDVQRTCQITARRTSTASPLRSAETDIVQHHHLIPDVRRHDVMRRALEPHGLRLVTTCRGTTPDGCQRFGNGTVEASCPWAG